MSQIEEPMEPPKKPKWSGLSHIKIDKKEAVSGFRWSLFYNVINKFILPVLNNAVVLRILGPGIGGLYALSYAFFSASDTFRDFGLSQTYMRDKNVTPQREASYMALGILQGLVPGALIFALRFKIADYYSSPDLAPLMVWVSLGLLINGFWTIPKAKVLRAGRIRESGAREMIANVLATGLSIWMLFHGYRNAMCLVFPLFINCVLNVVITYGLAPVTNFRTDIRTMLKTGRSAVSTLGASALYNIFIQVDKFVIGRFAGSTPSASVAAAGLYSQGQGLAVKPMQLLSVPMMAPLQAAFSQNSDDRKKLGSMYARSLAAALIFIVPLYAIAIVAAGPVTLLLLGHKWRGSIPLMQICSVFFAARTIGTIGGTALVAGGKARFAMTSWVFAYAVAFVGCVLAANLKGTPEARTEAFAWAFSIGSLAVYSVHTTFALRWFPPDSRAQHKIKAALLISVLSCLLFAGIYFLPLGPWIAVILACILGPLFHLAIIGWAFERKSLAYMSYEGAKRLYHSL